MTHLELDTIYAEARGEAFRSGKKRFYDNRVTELSFHVTLGKPRISAKVKGIEKDRLVSIDFDANGGLYDYACDCGAMDSASGPCRHIVAAALAYEDKFPPAVLPEVRSKKSAKTDAAVFNLSSEYAKRRRIRAPLITETGVALLPVLGMGDGGRLYLRFTVAKSRRYMLKDVSDFAAA